MDILSEKPMMNGSDEVYKPSEMLELHSCIYTHLASFTSRNKCFAYEKILFKLHELIYFSLQNAFFPLKILVMYKSHRINSLIITTEYILLKPFPIHKSTNNANLDNDYKK